MMLNWYQFIRFSFVTDKSKGKFSTSKKCYLTFWKLQLMYVNKRTKQPKSLNGKTQEKYQKQKKQEFSKVANQKISLQK